MSGSYSLGIDIGGTFTDIVAYDQATGQVVKAKELTTPDDPSRGVITGIRNLLGIDGLGPNDFRRMVHATTLFTNAIITRDGAKTGMLTTGGFRDAVEIGRERKYELYDVFITKPDPLVPRDLRVEISERIGPDGAVLTPIDIDAVKQEAARLVDEGVESLAIVFLHCYANSAHEDAAVEAISAAHPGLFLSSSNDVSPEIREYERASTTSANAYVKPLAQRYLDNLVVEANGLGITAPFFMMLSNGGLTHLEEAKSRPVLMLESGPAAGALVAAHFGGLAGEKNILAFDMGGTTAKLAMVEDGEPHVAYSFEAAREKRFVVGSGLPMNISTIELIEIGAGGGSIAHVDGMGLLKVGPRSAGSEPGPVCYGRGGKEPTVTDADLLLGYLNPEYFAGGSMNIDPDVSRVAAEPLAQALGLTVPEVAWGIHDVVNENMASAARVHIAEQGNDVREFTLLATGGAGPVHAYYVARKLGLRRLICPASAGVASALGLLIAPARVDRTGTVARRFSEMDWEALEAQYQALQTDAANVIAETGFAPSEAVVTRLADMRFAGQGFEIVLELPSGPYNAGSAPALRQAFEEVYRETFARTPPDVEPEIINIRISMKAEVPGLGIKPETDRGSGNPKTGSRLAYFPGLDDFVDTPVYDRNLMTLGYSFSGPAIVEESESTLILGPEAEARVDKQFNLIVDLPEEG
ncbi:MAG: Acetophenone carboxylase gamma subunit [Alphaproteobacteria bacterium MarineAlpha4_Bin2]|nr:MAG: Acetophenone carboxylase gamma subunit [Alphaproteobacteria bacterium MarineAlpha4_Bin2]